MMAAGDDISLPDRTEKLVRAWLDGDKRSDGIYSGYLRLNPDGEPIVVPQSPPTLDAFIRQCTVNVLGATAAWRPRLWTEWGPLPADAWAEDRILCFRALLCGGLTLVPEPLVRYRESSMSSLARSIPWRARSLWRWQRDLEFYDCYARELNAYTKRNQGGEGRLEELAAKISRQKAILKRDCDLLRSGGVALLVYSALLLTGLAWVRASLRSRARLTRSLLWRHFVKRDKVEFLDPRNHRALQGKLTDPAAKAETRC